MIEWTTLHNIVESSITVDKPTQPPARVKQSQGCICTTMHVLFYLQILS